MEECALAVSWKIPGMKSRVYGFMVPGVECRVWVGFGILKVQGLGDLVSSVYYWGVIW